jgi:Domain of unknown function (DUF4304)
MHTMDVESFAAALGLQLKAHGFRKQRLNWRKDLGESIAVLNVQISPWGDRSYYVNVGVYLKVLGEELAPPHNRCHVQQRLAVEQPESVASAALEWFGERANLRLLAQLHGSGRLKGKGLVFKEVMHAIGAT